MPTEGSARSFSRNLDTKTSMLRPTNTPSSAQTCRRMRSRAAGLGWRRKLEQFRFPESQRLLGAAANEQLTGHVEARISKFQPFRCPCGTGRCRSGSFPAEKPNPGHAAPKSGGQSRFCPPTTGYFRYFPKMRSRYIDSPRPRPGRCRARRFFAKNRVDGSPGPPRHRRSGAPPLRRAAGCRGGRARPGAGRQLFVLERLFEANTPDPLGGLFDGRNAARAVARCAEQPIGCPAQGEVDFIC